jgi:hypothetical protein
MAGLFAIGLLLNAAWGIGWALFFEAVRPDARRELTGNSCPARPCLIRRHYPDCRPSAFTFENGREPVRAGRRHYL